MSPASSELPAMERSWELKIDESCPFGGGKSRRMGGGGMMGLHLCSPGENSLFVSLVVVGLRVVVVAVVVMTVSRKKKGGDS